MNYFLSVRLLFFYRDTSTCLKLLSGLLDKDCCIPYAAPKNRNQNRLHFFLFCCCSSVVRCQLADHLVRIILFSFDCMHSSKKHCDTLKFHGAVCVSKNPEAEQSHLKSTEFGNQTVFLCLSSRLRARLDKFKQQTN